jgi:hypothetical protein
MGLDCLEKKRLVITAGGPADLFALGMPSTVLTEICGDNGLGIGFGKREWRRLRSAACTRNTKRSNDFI